MKILFTDFDGTLATDDKKISDNDFAALKLLDERGVKIVLTTGRMTASARQLLKLFPCAVYLATFNGSELFDVTGEQIESIPLEPTAAAEIIDYAKSKNLFCQIYSDEVISEELNDYTKRYGDMIGCKVRKSDTGLHEFIIKNDFRTPKVQICDFSGKTDEIFDDFIDKFGDRYECVRIGENWINVSSKGINKGYALNRLCSYLGIDTRDAVAIGDDLNDISMIKAAGIGVAVQNAADEVKLEADIVTESENGRAIEEITEKIFGFNRR